MVITDISYNKNISEYKVLYPTEVINSKITTTATTYYYYYYKI